MEVHHHPHVGKKSFVQYLLEGLMIFIAVSMGFIAEGIHERMTNREIEKTNMEIILGNLKQDTASLNSAIRKNEEKAVNLDSILGFKNSDLREPAKVQRLNDFISAAVTDYLFNSNRAAYDQMKTSGSLRLVKSKQVLDSLFSYEQADWLVNNNAGYYRECSRHFIDDMLGLFDIVSPKAALLETDTKSREYITRLGKFYNDVAAFRGDILGFYNPSLVTQKESATRLIKLLEEEYHLAEHH